ncbi:MAG: DUF502 domain-containing protein [Planctomycetes bacterium]|nr:DUF502 domain-containing protein [Planctomycetota bacterium]
MSSVNQPSPSRRNRKSATYFFLRGVAITLPPVLTLLILVWAGNGFNTYVIQPINFVVRFGLATWNNSIKTADQLTAPPPGYPAVPDWGRNYLVTQQAADEFLRRRPTEPVTLNAELKETIYVVAERGTGNGKYVPLSDYELVFKELRPVPLPTTAIGLYMEIVSVREFRSQWVLSALSLSLAIVAMYFLGRLVTARVGAWFVRVSESLLTRVPLVRNVYSTVKQVTDFVFSDREVEFQRVVALEYPRAGAWTLGFVTGEGMLDCATVVGEPMVTVLIPTSPVPAGGFTVMVAKSSVIDLNLTVDQAVQFIVSCGVLIPPQQKAPEGLSEAEFRSRLAGAPASAMLK